MISICIPCYNDHPKALIEELLSQIDTEVYKEIIIYDDFSTIPLTLDLRSDLVKVIRGMKNVGSLESRRQLAQEAKTSQILFLDADLRINKENFLNTYATHSVTDYDLIHSQVTYQKKTPDADRMLRWKYGNKREERIPSTIINNYDLFVSASFMIKKDVFLRLTERLENIGYGSDNLLSYIFQKNRLKMFFIDNPVTHLGLDTNLEFLNKSLRSVKTTFDFEMKGLISNNHRPVQVAYLRLKKLRSVKVFVLLIQKYERRLLNNILSKNPSILFLDLLKLKHFCELKDE